MLIEANSKRSMIAFTGTRFNSGIPADDAASHGWQPLRPIVASGSSNRYYADPLEAVPTSQDLQ